MTTARISAEGLVTIPEDVRDRLGWKPGTEVVIEAEGESLLIKRVVKEFPDWRAMEGMAKGTESLTKALEEDRAAENAHYEARIRKDG